jgi:hypothetical protein
MRLGEQDARKRSQRDENKKPVRRDEQHRRKLTLIGLRRFVADRRNRCPRMPLRASRPLS